MSSPGLDLARARVLVTNDDGVAAPGLKVLERIAKACAKDVWVVAPDSEQSAASHSLTLRRPLRVRKLGRRRFSVDGTPTDCVLVAQRKILADRPADIVLSGVNQGANLGEDVSYSGTVAAAKEGASLGMPAVAFSQVHTSDGDLHWETAERFGIVVLRAVADFAWRKGLLINVNFPPVACAKVSGIQVCDQGQRDATVELIEYRDPKDRPYIWVGDFTNDQATWKGSDLAAIEAGAVSVTPLHLDMTHRPSLKPLKDMLG
jgi:5'-nucleotidase